MSNAEVQGIVKYAASRGVVIEEFEAESFLRAKKILERDADHPNARTVVENFNTHLTTGNRPWSFAEFTLGEAS
jgi:hypothetical protein